MPSLNSKFAHLPHAAAVGAALSRRLPPGVDREDIEGVAWAAYHRWACHPTGSVADESPGLVYSVVRHAILDELRRLDRLSTHTRTRFNKIKAASSKLEDQLGRSPNLGEVASALGKSYYDIQGIVDAGNAACAEEFASDLNGSDSVVFDQTDPFLEATKQETAAVMREAVKELPTAERAVVKLVVLEGTPVARAALKLRKSDHEIRTLRDRGLKYLSETPALIELATT